MDTSYLVMLLAFSFGAAVSFLSGRTLLGAIIPAVSAGLYASIGAISHLSWFIGIFLMAAIPCGAISFLGAAVGMGVRSRLPQTQNTRIWGGIVALMVILGIVGIMFLRSNSTAKWDAVAETSAKEYAVQQRQVLERTGGVRSASVHMKTSQKDSPLPYISFTYYVRGTTGNALVAVGVSGSISAPTFNLLSVEPSK